MGLEIKNMIALQAFQIAYLLVYRRRLRRLVEIGLKLACNA